MPSHPSTHRPRRLALGLVALAFLAAACQTATVGHTGKVAATPDVLGQPKGAVTVHGTPAPAGTGSLTDVSCPDAEHCWAVGVADPNVATHPIVIVSTADGGVTWKNDPLTTTTTPALTGVSCPTVTDCLAVGSTAQGLGAGVVLATHDGGTTWATLAPPTGAFQMIAIRCAALTNCTAIVNDGTFTWSALTTTFGRSWQREGNLPAGLEGVGNLTCDAVATCLVVGYSPTTAGHGQASIAISTNNAVSWTAANVPSGLGVLQGATCITALRCLAVGTTSTTVSDVVPAKGELLASFDGGHTWAPEATDLSIDSIFGVECPAPKTCALVGTSWVGHNPVIGAGAVARSTDGGVTFVAAKAAYIPLSLTSLSCPTAIGCIAVGGDTVARIALPAVATSSPAATAGHGRREAPPR